MNFLSISSSQRSASLSYFKNNKEVISIESEQGFLPSVWLPDGLALIQKTDNAMLDTLHYIAVDIGPGSFTGIKVAIAFAKGLAANNNLVIVPVNAMEGLASLNPGNGTIAIIKDARRGLYYLGIFGKKGEALQCIVAPCVVVEEELKNMIRKISGKDLYIIADTHIPFVRTIGGEIITIATPYSKGVGIQSILHYQTGGITDSSLLKPLYLRPPDAEISKKAL